MNRACFGRHAPTDVISIAYPPLPPVARAWRGEVAINTDCACREGPAHGGVARELALYLAHGCHHLSGADDATPEERRRMRQRENRWLRRPDIRPLIAALLEEPFADA